MTRDDVSPREAPSTEFTQEQLQEIQNLLRNGGGVTYEDIAFVVYGEQPRPLYILPKRDPLDAYLLRLIAEGQVKRVWNKELQDHFYLWTD